MVGGCGFLVDAGVLAVAVHAYHIDAIAARVVSFAVAVCVTWALNRNFTFGVPKGRGLSREFLLYLVVSLLGFATNFVVYAALVKTVAITAQYPVIALVPSSLLAAWVNYAGAAHIAFRPSPDQDGHA